MPDSAHFPVIASVLLLTLLHFFNKALRHCFTPLLHNSPLFLSSFGLHIATLKLTLPGLSLSLDIQWAFPERLLEENAFPTLFPAALAISLCVQFVSFVSYFCPKFLTIVPLWKLTAFFKTFHCTWGELRVKSFLNVHYRKARKIRN